MPAADLLARARAWLAEQGADAVRPKPVPEPASPPAAEAPDDVTLAVEVAAQLARAFEGLYLLPYLCPAGVPTIGYGATYYESGARVTLRDPAITRERAEALLLWHVRTVYLPAVLMLCPGVTDPHRLAALIDFTFNLGAGALRSSTLRKRVNADRWADVPVELRKWVYAAGKRLRGLERRREAEIAVLPDAFSLYLVMSHGPPQ